MRNHLILLPGWSLGSAALEPLAASLRAQDAGLRVELAALPNLVSDDRRPGSTSWTDACPRTPGWVVGHWAACSPPS